MSPRLFEIRGSGGKSTESIRDTFEWSVEARKRREGGRRNVTNEVAAVEGKRLLPAPPGELPSDCVDRKRLSIHIPEVTNPYGGLERDAGTASEEIFEAAACGFTICRRENPTLNMTQRKNVIRF